MAPRDQMRKGSTDFVILSLLVKRPMYGYEICQQLDQRSGGYFEMKEGLLYPTLHRMQQKGWLMTDWDSLSALSWSSTGTLGAATGTSGREETVT